MNSVRKAKIGLALGSGGIKGFAHLGALKAFEESNIEFDIIAGSSIGSIVGALYAKGYTVGDMTALIGESGILNPQTLMMIGFGGMNLPSLISKVVGDMDFTDLKKPFTAIATDIDTGEEVVIKEGNVAYALSASSAIPPVFRPVEIGNKRLIDGAFVNSVPADAVKKDGADYIVSINLGSKEETNQQIKMTLDEMYPENSVKLANRSWQCYKYSDIVLEPDLSPYVSGIIGDFGKIYEVGYQCAKNKIEDILDSIKGVR